MENNLKNFTILVNSMRFFHFSEKISQLYNVIWEYVDEVMYFGIWVSIG